MRHRHHTWNRGFTLIELLISTLILGIGLVALSQLYLAAMWTYQKGHYLSVATQRAQSELEIIHNLSYSDLTVGELIDNEPYEAAGSSYTSITGGRGVRFVEDALPTGTGTVTVTTPYVNTDGVAMANVAQVVIDIEWDAKPPEESRVHIVTLKTGPPSGGQ